MARAHDIGVVLHVAMYRPTPDAGPQLSVGGAAHPIAREVWEHFRQIKNIQALAGPVGIQIELFDRPFHRCPAFRGQRAAREDYFAAAAGRVRRIDRPLVVFADPDNGLAPKTAGWKHITGAELRTLYGAMKAGDLLVAYQHQYRRHDWADTARAKITTALGLQASAAGLIKSDYAPDVVLIHVSKLPTPERPLG